MSGSVNKVILVGNVGKEPEMFSTQSGSKFANFSIATNESWRNKETGEQERKTEWHRVVVFNENLANIAEQYVRKGSKIYIEGQLQTRKWTDANSVERYSTEIVLSRFRGELHLLDSRNDNNSQFPPPPENSSDYGQKSSSSYTNSTNSGSDALDNKTEDLIDDEVPF